VRDSSPKVTIVVQVEHDSSDQVLGLSTYVPLSCPIPCCPTLGSSSGLMVEGLHGIIHQLLLSCSTTKYLQRQCAKYGFEKPNDKRALELMNAAARAVLTEIPEITVAYGVSDEYRLGYHATNALQNRD